VCYLAHTICLTLTTSINPFGMVAIQSRGLTLPHQTAAYSNLIF